MIQVMLNEEEEEEVRTHPNHQHPLLLHENMPGRLIFYWLVCGDYFLNRYMAYGCIPCLFFIHKSCFERKFPPKLHPMVFLAKLVLSLLSFGTIAVNSDVVWWILIALYYPPPLSMKQIHHFLDGHPLILGKNKQLLDDEEEVNNCCVCGKGCSTGPTYVCRRASSEFC